MLMSSDLLGYSGAAELFHGALQDPLTIYYLKEHAHRVLQDIATRTHFSVWTLNWVRLSRVYHPVCSRQLSLSERRKAPNSYSWKTRHPATPLKRLIFS